MRNKISLNDKFNNLTVIELLSKPYIEPSGKHRSMVKVKCDCGYEFEIQTLILKRKGQKCYNCRFNSDSVVSMGKKYNQLIVKGFIKLNGKKKALCQCECGKEITARPDQLVRNITKHCGCQHKANWRGIGSLSQTFINRIKRNACVRNISFDLTKEYLWKLFEKQDSKCALSGQDISFGKSTLDTNDASLDRIDSNLGYIIGNVQWLHKDVNKMKMELNQNRFIELCKLISSKN